MDSDEIKNRKLRLEQEIQAKQEEMRKQLALLEAYRLVELDMDMRELCGEPGLTPTSASSAGAQPIAATNGSEHNMSANGDSNQEGREYGYNSRMVDLAISHMTDTYSLREIHKWLKDRGENITKDQVATVLVRFRDSRKITVCRHGKGRRPTTYKPPVPAGQPEDAI
jgi:hypothetical protein